MSIEFVALTDTGQKRQVNEDSLWPQSTRHEHEADAANGMLFIIADGMGGHGAGDIASSLAVNEIADKYYGLAPGVADISQRLKLAIQAAHELVRNIAAQSTETEQMGTTVVTAVVKFDEKSLRGQAWLAWVGDSRIYLQRGGKLRQVSRDHSRLWPLIEAGQISWDELKLHPDRSRITNALVAQQLDTSPEFLQLGLEPGDILLLCSDGLSGEVRPELIEQTLAAHPPSQAAALLIEQANAPTETMAEGRAISLDGGNDNISLIIVKMPVDQTDTQPLAVLTPDAVSSQTQVAPSTGAKLPRMGLVVIAGLLLLVGLVGGAVVAMLSGRSIFATSSNVAMITATVQPAFTATPLPAQPAVIVAVGSGDEPAPAGNTPAATPLGQLLESTTTETREPTVTRGPVQTPTSPPTATYTPLPLPTATPTQLLTATTVVTLDVASLLPPLLLEPEADETGKFSRDSTKETRFVWQSPYELPADLGFEIFVWLKGREPTGAYDARLLRQAASYRQLSDDRYTVTLVLAGANGVTASSPDYVWSVAIVRLEPEYEWLGVMAEPRPISLVVPTTSE